MKMIGASFLCVLLLFVPRASSGQDNVDSLRADSLAALNRALVEQKEWIRVHAAETLIWNGHPDAARSEFAKEEDAAGPKYRIGVWRVLAQAAATGEERAMYLDKIRGAFLDEDGPDRVHAVETLAKLNDLSQREAFLDAATGVPGPLASYATWALANSGAEEDEARLAALLDSEDSQTRGTTAYAMRFLPRLRNETRTKLHEAAREEPADSPARAYLVSAWFVHAGETERGEAGTWLSSYLESGSTGEQYEAAMALALRGTAEDLPALAKLLREGDTDAQIAAAHAILTITGRP